jgi:uncharacterized membrane protein
MHPSEQPYQENASQQVYGMYIGREQPYEQEQNNFTGNWMRDEGMAGRQSQQQLYGQPMFSAPMRLVPKGVFFAILSYSLGWFSALIILFFSWQNRFVRFHALQSLFFFGFVNVFDIILLRTLLFWHHLHIWILPVLCIFLLVNIIAAIAWIIGMIQAGLGNYYKLPPFGNLIMRKFVTPVSVK